MKEKNVESIKTSPSEEEATLHMEMSVVNINIPYWDLAKFFLKCVVACIPAAFVALVVGIVIKALLGAIAGGAQ